MFCTKCGKKLHDDDRFCAHCGAEVRQEKRSRYDDVVFNPPFKVEAQRRTEEIVKFADEQKAEKRARETVSFDWNLDGFPSAQPKKTEEVNFNWDSVVERRNSSRGIQVEKIQPEPEVFFAPLKTAADKEPLQTEEPASSVIPEVEELLRENTSSEPSMSVEELEKELFSYEKEHPSEVVEPTIPYELSKRWSQEVAAVTTEEPVQKEAPAQEISDISGISSAKPEEFTGDSRFYTYNQKFDAFQELLEKEREKLRNMEEAYNKDMENLDYTWVGEVFPELVKENPQDEPEESVQVREPEVVGVSAPYCTMAIDIVDSAVSEETEEESIPQEISRSSGEETSSAGEAPEAEEAEPSGEMEEEVPQQEAAPSKTKLRYSDVFPRSLVDDDDSSSAADPQSQLSEEKTEITAAKPEEPVKPADKSSALSSIYDDIDEGDEPKKHIFAKIIIGILVLLVLVEGVVIAAKLIAPESRLSIWANDLMLSVADMISGGSQDSQGGEDDESLYQENEKDIYMSGLLTAASADAKTIGEAAYNGELTFDSISTYYFDEIPQADNFVDADWFTDSQDQTVTYGQRIMEALVRYYDSWQGVNNDESLVGINCLETGEIRTGNEGFYVLCRITYAGADGGEVVKYHTVYLRISDETMIINEIKEGN